MKRQFVNGLIILIVAILGLTSFPVFAQTPIPDPTATPGYLLEVELEPGVSFMVERHFTYGDMAIVASLLIVMVVIIVSAFSVVVSRTIRN